MAVRAIGVFTQGSFPIHTHMERPSAGLEQPFEDALATPGQIISLSGSARSLQVRIEPRDLEHEELFTHLAATARLTSAQARAGWQPPLVGR